jgi:hypothetical protein
LASSKPKHDRLLAGEDPETIRPQDAQHWMAVYAEMIGFKTHMLEQVHTALERVSAAARVDLQDDVTLLEAQLERYERRVAFWSERSSVLAGEEGERV